MLSILNSVTIYTFQNKSSCVFPAYLQFKVLHYPIFPIIGILVMQKIVYCIKLASLCLISSHCEDVYVLLWEKNKHRALLHTTWEAVFVSRECGLCRSTWPRFLPSELELGYSDILGGFPIVSVKP